MKKILSIWAILMLGLLVFGGVVMAQEEEEATETKTIETQVMTQPPANCRLMVQPMGGMMGSMGQGQMGCGMMPGMMGCMGEGGMCCRMTGCKGGAMGCGECCKQLMDLGCPTCLMEMAAELELTDKQIMELKTLCSAHKKDVIRKNADLKVAEMELGDLTMMPDPDMAKIRAKITAIGEMKQDMCLAQLATIEKAHRVLTSEQMTKLKEMRKEKCCPMGKAGAGQTMKKCIKMKVIK